MKTELDCIRCFCDNLFHMTSKLEIPAEQKVRMSKEVMSLICASDFSQSPPLIAAKINRIICSYCPGFEPYRREKDLSTQYARELLDTILPELSGLEDPFDAYVRLAIGGNIIDFGVNCKFDLNTAREMIVHSLTEVLDSEALALLRRKMESAGTILYLMDNCGEAVFDTLLVGMFREKITLAVRGRPILNDITMREVEASGLSAARIIDTGDATPGISLTDSSPEFMEAYRSADLILAKGQGNYETLCDDSDRPVFFLFRAKCPVVTRNLGGVKTGSYQIRHVNMD